MKIIKDDSDFDPDYEPVKENDGKEERGIKGALKEEEDGEADEVRNEENENHAHDMEEESEYEDLEEGQLTGTELTTGQGNDIRNDVATSKKLVVPLSPLPQLPSPALTLTEPQNFDSQNIPNHAHGDFTSGDFTSETSRSLEHTVEKASVPPTAIDANFNEDLTSLLASDPLPAFTDKDSSEFRLLSHVLLGYAKHLAGTVADENGTVSQAFVNAFFNRCYDPFAEMFFTEFLVNLPPDLKVEIWDRKLGTPKMFLKKKCNDFFRSVLRYKAKWVGNVSDSSVAYVFQ